MPGNFAEFGPESSGPGLAISKQSEWALQSQQALQAAAHSRYFNAHAGQLEQSAAQDAMLAAAAPGAFAEDSTPGQPVSRATPYYKLAQIAGNFGMVKKAEELVKTGRELDFKTQEIATSAANQALHVVQARKAQHEQNVEKAGELLSIPTQDVYDNWRMTRSAQGDDVSDLPSDLATAKRMVQPLYLGSVKAVDAAKAAEQKIKDKAEMDKWNAQARAAGAAAGTSAARAKLLGLYADDITANGGDTSKGARDARESRTEANKQAAAAKAEAARLKNMATFTAAPVNPLDRKIGKTYRSPDGTVLSTYLGVDPKTKLPKWGPAIKAMSEVQKARVQGVLNEPDLPDLGE